MKAQRNNELASIALENLYGNRSSFLVLGLTARTGSGCSTVANLLTSENWADLKKTQPIEEGKALTNEDRKYRICFNYLSEHWNPFIEISFSDVILTFLIDTHLKSIKTFMERYLSSEDYSKTHEFLIKDKQTLKLPELSTNPSADDCKKYTERFEKIREFKETLKGLLKEQYTPIMQSIGNNLRRSGSTTKSEIDPSKLHSIQRRIKTIIQCYRTTRESLPCYFILDSIRNDLEAQYFRAEYAAFYMISVNVEEKIRRQRLTEGGNLTIEQIRDIDSNEYNPSQTDSYDKFSSINVQNCIEHSDIHINNDIDTNHLGTQLIRYISLILRPGIVQPTKQEQLMQMAYTAKMNSGCISRQVGAVISCQNYSVKAIGWNDSPSKQVPCRLRSAQHLLDKVDSSAYSDYEKEDTVFHTKLRVLFPQKNKNGLPDSFCFKCVQNKIDGEKNQVHTRALHAEENAMMQIAKHGGMGLKGGFLFTTASPCELCSKKAYQLNIDTIYYIDPYPGIATTHILKSGSLKPKLVLFTGVIGRSYFKLYDAFMPYKDELNILNHS